MEKIFKWCKLSAEQGDAEAQFTLAGMYVVGNGVEEDAVEAFKWYRLSAEQGNDKAYCALGKIYFYGYGIKQNYKEALMWFKLAADKGNVKAQCSLGVIYFNGYGVEKDYVEAFKWFELAADQKDAEAQFYIGKIYGLVSEVEEAAKWYKLSACRGNAKAQFALGKMYLNGSGVEKDYEEAFGWFKLSADHGYAKAQCYLGGMYYSGYGVKKDYEEAAKCFKLSADQGNIKAQHSLGISYYKGYGVKKDYREAIKWVKLAADQGNIKAQKNLEKIYNKENEIKKDCNLYVPTQDKSKRVEELKIDNYKFNEFNFWREKQIFYLGDYQQYTLYDENGDEHRNPKFTDESGGYIKQIKNDKEKGRKYYENKLIAVFKSNQEFSNTDYWITIIPSCEKNRLSDSMIKLTKRIEREFNNIAYHECLRRTRTIEKLAYGGNRDINTHLSSIEVIENKDKIKGQKIILLDDVTTSGNSMIACKRLLEEAGAEVICISLSKTVERKSYEEALLESEKDGLVIQNDFYTPDDYEDTTGMIYCVEDDSYHDADVAWLYDGSRD